MLLKTQSTPAANSPSGQIPPEEQQTKRILWIMPNFRAVSTGTNLPKQSVKEKFKTAALDSFDYSSFVFAGIQAGISQATDAYPDCTRVSRDMADIIGTRSPTRQTKIYG